MTILISALKSWLTDNYRLFTISSFLSLGYHCCCRNNCCRFWSIWCCCRCRCWGCGIYQYVYFLVPNWQILLLLQGFSDHPTLYRNSRLACDGRCNQNHWRRCKYNDFYKNILVVSAHFWGLVVSEKILMNFLNSFSRLALFGKWKIAAKKSPSLSI